MFYILLAAAVLAAVLFYAKTTKRRTAQDVVGDTEIAQDGLIRSGNNFRLVIEVEPKNLDTASEAEQKACGLTFCRL